MCVYPNLEKEIKEKGISKKFLAKQAKIRYQTFIVKSHGKNYFTLDEAVDIKNTLETDMPLEQLFYREQAGA